MYVRTKVSVSKGQAEKVARAIESGSSVTIRLSNSDLVGDHVIAVTRSQLNKIERARAHGVGLDLKLSKAQLKHNRSFEGGFIGAILPFLAKAGSFLVSKVLPTLASGLLTGAASAAGGRAVDAIANAASGSGVMDSLTPFMQGNNPATFNNINNVISKFPLPFQNMAKSFLGNAAIYLKNKGSGIKIKKVGQGLYLSPWKKHTSVNGAGLYLKPQGSGYVDGSGLILGPNSPIAKIPILGDLLGWLL